MLQSHLVELPINQLLERINTEMDDNPALEAEPQGEPAGDDGQPADQSQDDGQAEEDYATVREREERQSALDEALASIGRDDGELPVYHGGQAAAEEREEIVYGDTATFYDQLKEQMGETELTPRQRTIMEYIIGSLDDDGLLRKSTDAIADELAIYHGTDTTAEEVDGVLARLQQFDPPGIGARNLQECLLLQIDRREPSPMTEMMRRVVAHMFGYFTKKHWDKIRAALSLDDSRAAELLRELRKLNPKPGASMGEAVGRSVHQITPDFIVDTQDDGTVTFTLNTGDVPQMKEALLYTKKKVEAAQGFIEAIKVRRRTLTMTMQAIINWQHRFFEDGDEASLRPMILKDIAEKTGLDISTVSRVTGSKYAQTRWGTFPLRHFFSDSLVTESGEELSTRRIKAALRDIVEAEDKQRPLSDDALKDALAAQGFPIARRTVAKYREQLGIPIARLRR